MNKKILEQEKAYLNKVLVKIDEIADKSKKEFKQNQEKIQSFKEFFAENFYELKDDEADDEIAQINLQIENLENQNVLLKHLADRLKKQKKNPYFGRFDFQSSEDESPQKYYIGLGNVQDESKNNFVYDWRADISSLYYYDVIGKTSYTCMDGKISGDVTLKRQYRIENGKLKYYIDSNLIIDDEILMEQLSRNASSKMHEIVSTIQKEQNILIRSDDFSNIIVQGVAGSGKTSIAMHRVSYLLYKYRDKLKSEDILILSPSEMFSNYLSEVLPSLGEEKAFTTTFSDMTRHLLGIDFETREELLDRVISKQSQEELNEIAIKSSFEFLEDLKTFLNKSLCNLFIPKPMSFGEVVISKEELYDLYFNKLQNLTVAKRIEILAEYMTDKFNISQTNRPELFKRAKKLLYNKFLTTDLLKIYNLFLESIELKPIKHIGAYDVAPMLLIKESLFGLKNNYDAKYVIVDEMQDYSPCHFHLFDQIWKVPKLYLGDVNQSIDRTIYKNYLNDLAKLTKSKIKFLNKSYRSTMQIALFSQKILGKRVANNVNRNGEEVEFIRTKNVPAEIEKILQLRSGNGESIAIICKTADEIRKLKKESALIKKFKTLNGGKLNSKKIIATPSMAKGVEFDCVIIPYANAENYKNELDRNLLYVSSTRALHKLYFISNTKPSKFLVKSSSKAKEKRTANLSK